ncbi:MAG: hypothetical protein HOK35_11445 [Cytophagia bacterium]|nr:hypothetical protein [Cytophagia bacterium]
MESTIDSDYNSLITSIALGYPNNSYKPFFEDALNIKDSLYRNTITEIDKSIFSGKLNLQMNLHTWTMAPGHEYPNAIIYVTNNSDFEHAFSFFDEQYYLKLKKLKRNDKSFNLDMCNLQLEEINKLKLRIEDELKNHLIFEQQVNFILDGLKLTKYSSSEKEYYTHKKLNEFITILTISLLDMNEIELRDIVVLRKNLEMIKSDDNKLSFMYDKKCFESYENTIVKIENDLKAYKNIRYFEPFEGWGSFWRFEVLRDINDDVFVKISFENLDCYTVIYI